MSHRTQEEDFEDLPVRRKQVKERDTQAALEARVRLEVLQTSEDWITDKFIAACVGAGTKHIGTILQKMTKEGVLSELTSVPMVEADDPQVKIHRQRSNFQYDVVAFIHDGKWCIGYYDRSTADARKTSLIYGRPDIYRYRRGQGAKGTIKRRCTAAERERYRHAFKYKEADWDGKARLLLRNSQAFIDACVAVGVEPETDIPWDCAKCGRRNGPRATECSGPRCNGRKPRYLAEPDPKICPKCGEPDLDGHSRRHSGRGLEKVRHKCLVKMVEAVHKV